MRLGDAGVLKLPALSVVGGFVDACTKPTRVECAIAYWRGGVEQDMRNSSLFHTIVGWGPVLAAIFGNSSNATLVPAE